MISRWRVLCVTFVIVFNASLALAHPPLKTEGRGDVRPEEEAFIHTPAGFHASRQTRRC
jgi:hypothetical protein